MNSRPVSAREIQSATVLRRGRTNLDFAAGQIRVLVGAGVLLAGSTIIALMGFFQSDRVTIDQMLCYAFACLAAVLLYFAVFDDQLRASGLEFRKPIPLYGSFYALYYVVPLTIYAQDDWVPKHNLNFMLCVIMLGFSGFYLGVRISGTSRIDTGHFRGISAQDGKAVLILGYIAALFVALHFGFRVAVGQFFSHTEALADTSLMTSFLGVFCGAFPFIVIPFMGLAAANCDKVLARHARLALKIYTALLFVTFLASSQFRPALTVLVLYAIVRPLSGSRALTLKQVLLLLCIAAFALVVIQQVRVTADESKIASVPEQAGYAVKHTYESAIGLLSGKSLHQEITLNTESRASSTVKFLSKCRDALALGGNHLHGATFVASIYSQIPRLFWMGKGLVMPAQSFIEQELRMEDVDASPNPVTQFYVEWDVPGVFFGFLIFGFLIGMITRVAFQTRSIPMLILAFWLWCASIQVETELFRSILGSLRLAAVTIALYYLFRFCILSMSRVVHRV